MPTSWRHRAQQSSRRDDRRRLGSDDGRQRPRRNADGASWCALLAQPGFGQHREHQLEDTSGAYANAAYASSKAALVGLTREMALELGPMAFGPMPLRRVSCAPRSTTNATTSTTWTR